MERRRARDHPSAPLLIPLAGRTALAVPVRASYRYSAFKTPQVVSSTETGGQWLAPAIPWL